MNKKGIISGGMISGISGFFNLTCTIQESAETQNEIGEPIETWTNKAGHVDIPCAVGQSKPFPWEQKRPDMTPVIAEEKIALQGYYPAVTEAMRAVVGSTTYDIIKASTSQQEITWLTVQVVR